MAFGRKLACVVAILGMFMQAGMAAAHNSAMLQAKLSHQSLLDAFAAQCLSAAADPDNADIPALPEPAGQQQQKCPLCLGAVSCAPPAGPDLTVIARKLDALFLQSVREHQAIAERISGLPPPSRAPPQA